MTVSTEPVLEFPVTPLRCSPQLSLTALILVDRVILAKAHRHRFCFDWITWACCVPQISAGVNHKNTLSWLANCLVTIFIIVWRISNDLVEFSDTIPLACFQSLQSAHNMLTLLFTVHCLVGVLLPYGDYLLKWHHSQIFSWKMVYNHYNISGRSGKLLVGIMFTCCH